MFKRIALVLALGMFVAIVPGCAQSQKGGESAGCPGTATYHSDGTVYWDRSEDLSISFPAVADYNLDCLPEVVVTAPKLAEVQEQPRTLGEGVRQRPAFVVRLRTTRTSSNGIPALETPSRSVTKALTHIVYTRDADGNATKLATAQKYTTVAGVGAESG